jgi:hypothetical protein
VKRSVEIKCSSFGISQLLLTGCLCVAEHRYKVLYLAYKEWEGTVCWPAGMPKSGLNEAFDMSCVHVNKLLPGF